MPKQKGDKWVKAALFSSESNEWYTPASVIEAARLVLSGQIDLDPASCEFANRTVKAQHYFTMEQNGLILTWCNPDGSPARVFCNPPYGKTQNRSNQEIWFRKAVAEYRAGNIKAAVIVLRAATGEQWQQKILKEGWPYCLSGLLGFTPSPEAQEARRAEGKAAVKSSRWGSLILYLGSREKLFRRYFNEFGPVVPSFDPALEQTLTAVSCPVCLNQFLPRLEGSGRLQNYCSNACRQKAYRQRGSVTKNVTFYRRKSA